METLKSPGPQAKTPRSTPKTLAMASDVGNVVVQRIEDHGKRVDVPYDVTFAFVFKAFRPEGTLVQ